ncbi:cyclic-phosphate processing receiver domain-containing protein [Croceibacter atlanticus]|uniref:cyclic-phosphate processing receiver domain-containing protein n=1 Tax=Croceibacter atlanticus TaxID=313588 RepID=UPI0030FBB43D
MKLLWLDDLRNPFLNDEGTVPKENTHIEWVLSYEQFTQWIERFGLPEIISFDHDLADVFSNDREEKTGMDCAKWLVDYCLDNNVDLPKYYVHSANPVGSKNINGLLNNFKIFQTTGK